MLRLGDQQGPKAGTVWGYVRFAWRHRACSDHLQGSFCWCFREGCFRWAQSGVTVGVPDPAITGWKTGGLGRTLTPHTVVAAVNEYSNHSIHT